MSNAKNETFDMEIPCQILQGVRASARKISHMCGGDRGSRPSEPREARRAKAEALMIMYFHVVKCLWLLGWFGDVLSCLGCMLLCIFVLESFSRCCRPRARFVELIRCSRPWAGIGELIRRFPFSAAQVSSPVSALFDMEFPCQW